MLTILSFVLSNWRVVLYGGAALAIAVWALHERDTLINQGAQQERATMEAANAAALTKANAAATNVDTCYRGGGTWDRDHGLCVSAPARKPPVRR